MSRRNKVTKTTDAFSNPVYQLGFGTQNPIEATQYPLTRMSQNYALLNSLYRTNWIVQNIIDTIPSDMTKKWFELSGGVSQEAKRRMDTVMRATRLRKSIGDGLKWGRLYGGAAGIILIKGQENLEEPLNLDTIIPGTFAGLYVVDRWSGVYPEGELVTDMTDPDFGLPAYYTVRDESDKDVQRVHHSRVVRFIGRELPYYERIAETYWGESELEAIYDEIAKRDNVSHNIASLTFRACRDYMEMENVDQLFAIGGQQQQERFWRTMQAQAVLDTNFGMRVVNKGDAIHNTQYTFAGLADVYDGVMMDVSGAARIPVTKLFGRSPAGMNATGESDLQNYYDYIDEQRESRLRPIIERLLPVLALSAWGTVPDDLDIKFPPLWTPKAVELADIAAQKTQVVIAAFKAQLIDAGQAQAELKGLSDEIGMFGSIEDETIEANRGKSFEQLSDPFAGLSLPPSEDAVSTRDGGPGSGNFNHAGRPGEVGGSGGGGKGSGLTSGGESGILQSSSKPAWSAKEAKEPFDYWIMSEDKVRIARRWKPVGFSGKMTLDEHVEKHMKSVGAKTSEEYEAKAIAFLQSPRGAHGDAFIRKNGDICRYDYDTHEIAMARFDGTIRTYWNLSSTKSGASADQYWEEQKNGA